LQNSNQPHLPNQEIKASKFVKQKEHLTIKKSLLSKPIIVSKTTTKADSMAPMGPCKPTGLKRPVNKMNTKSHPLQLSTAPDHSTPIKDKVLSRRRSVAVSPKRDSSEATDDKSIIPTKQRRRSSIPLPGGMVRK